MMLFVSGGAAGQSLPPTVRTDYPTVENGILVPHGFVNPNGSAVLVWFEYTRSADLSGIRATVQQDFGSGTQERAVLDTTGMIQPNNPTWIRIAASNSGGKSAGDWLKVDQPLESALGMTLSRLDVSPDWTWYQANVQWIANPTGLPTTYLVEWSTYPEIVPGTANLVLNTPSDRSGPLSVTVWNLYPLTTYYYRLTATNFWGSWTSGIQKFTTGGTGPDVSNLKVASISDHEVSLNGTVVPHGFDVWVAGLCSDPVYPPQARVLVKAADGTTGVTVTVSGLTPGTTYHCGLEYGAAWPDQPPILWHSPNSSVTVTTTGQTPPDPLMTQTRYIPHVVTGGGFTTKMTITNLTAKTNNVKVNFSSQEGGLLTSTAYQLAAGATQRIETSEDDRWGPSTTTWALVGSDDSIGINVYYEFMNSDTAKQVVNAVGFNDPPAAGTQQFPVEFAPSSTGHFRTVGVALANPNKQSTNVVLTLTSSSGTTLASYQVSLGAFAQTAVDLSTVDAFKAVLPATDFAGVVRIDSQLKVAAITLGDDGGLFFATPAIGVSSRMPQFYVPHIVNGGGYLTTITLMNPWSTDLLTIVNYYPQNFTPASTRQLVTVPAYGSVRVTMPGASRSGSATTSWAEIEQAPPEMDYNFYRTPNSTVYATALIDLEDASTNTINAIGFNDAQLGTDFTIPVEFYPPSASGGVGRTVGLAIANPLVVGINPFGGVKTNPTVALKLVDSTGKVLATSNIVVNGLQTAIDLTTLKEFQAVLPPTNFVGLVTVSSPQRIVVVALGDDFGPFFATPPFAGRVN